MHPCITADTVLHRPFVDGLLALCRSEGLWGYLGWCEGLQEGSPHLRNAQGQKDQELVKVRPHATSLLAVCRVGFRLNCCGCTGIRR